MFSLTLHWRLALAFLSGTSIWLNTLLGAAEIGSYLGSDTGFPVTGFFLGTLVLVPFVGSQGYRVVRATALVIAAMAIQAMVVRVTLYTRYLSIFGVSSEPELVLNVTIGTVLLCAATCLIAPARMTPGLIGYAGLAGLVAGFVFYMIIAHVWSWLCFDPCPWWNDLAFVGGWVVWHMAICTAIYFGRSHRELLR